MMLRSVGAIGAIGASGRSVAVAMRSPCTVIAIRNHVINHYDYQPGKVPRTYEERKAAAAKYGIPLEKYETYEDDGLGYGDYPKLPIIPTEQRDPNYPWDQPVYKRNFGEPIHVDEVIINDGRLNYGVRQRVPILTQWIWFLSPIVFLSLVMLFNPEWAKYHPSVMEKQFPTKGKQHYSI